MSWPEVSLQDLTEKLGKPTTKNVKTARVLWNMDPFDFIAFFEKGFKTLKFISFVLPYASADRMSGSSMA